MSKLIYTLFILVLALSSQAQLKISEIMYNPPESGDDSLEYLEIFNLSLVEDFHLAGCYFSSGIVDTFGVNDIVPAGGYLVIAKRASAMQAVFGISPHQWKSGSLNNGGEVLTLLSPNGAIIFSLDFGDSGLGWVPEADGEGYSMELCNLASDPAYKDNWGKSGTGSGVIINGYEVYGTPGKANTATCQPVYADTVVVTNNKFTPAVVTITEGETVLWIFDQGTHNVNGSQSTFPANPDDFRSGSAAPAPYTFTHTFINPGTNDYRCDPHYEMGMVGQVIVKPLHPGKVYTNKTIEQAAEIDQNGVAVLTDSLVEVTGEIYGINMRASGISSTLIDQDNIGIGIFNASFDFGYNVTEGDIVKVRGTVSQFNGLQQIVLDTVIKVSSGNPLISPDVVPMLNEDTESSLVTLENVTLKNPSEWIQGSTFNATVTDGTNDFLIRVLNLTTLSSEPAPTGAFNITGIGGQYDPSSPYFEGYQLLPRYKEDLKLKAANKNSLSSSVSVFPNPASDMIFIDTKLKVVQLSIVDLNGRTVKISSMPYKIIIGDLLSGMYMLRLDTEEGTVFKTFIKSI